MERQSRVSVSRKSTDGGIASPDRVVGLKRQGEGSVFGAAW